MEPNVEMYAFMGGRINTQKQYVNKVVESEMTRPWAVPIPFYVIKHNDAYVLVDTGMSRKCTSQEGAVDAWGQAIADIFQPEMSAEEYLEEQLMAKLGLRPCDFNMVILSHGHMDHAGGLSAFSGTQVPVYVQKTELEAILRPDFGYIEEDFVDIEWVAIDGVHDLFGDGTVMIMPMPGHVLGLQCTMVKTNDGYFFLASDALDEMGQLDGGVVTARAADDSKIQQSYNTMKLMQKMGVHLVPQHDFPYWKNRPLAPATFK